MKKKSLIILSIIIISALCIAFTVRSFPNDTFYTIKVGETILTKGIDFKDHFSWHNLNYTYPHWLYDIIVYKIYNKGGFHLLYISNIIVFIIISLIFYFASLKKNKSYFLSLLFSILMVIMLAKSIVTRAQLGTYLLFLLEVIFIMKLLVKAKLRYGLYLFIICILIANIHAAVWPFYFVLMLPYFFEYLIFTLKKKINKKISFKIFSNKLDFVLEKNIKYLALVFLISLFLGLATPIKDTPYTYFLKILQGDTMNYIMEHKPLVLVENYFVIGYLVIFLGVLIFTKVKIRVADLAMISGLIIMSFISVRHVSLLGVIGMFYLCQIVCNIGKINSSNSLDFPLPWSGGIIVTLTILVTSGIVYNINAKESYIDESVYPVKMVNYMEKNLDMSQVKLYNEYDFGSYLLFKNIPVYIDSRSDLYTLPFNQEYDIFDECMNIENNYGQVFNKYNITHILIYRDTELNQILAASPNYEILHTEGRFMLYKYLNTEKGNS